MKKGLLIPMSKGIFCWIFIRLVDCYQDTFLRHRFTFLSDYLYKTDMKVSKVSPLSDGSFIVTYEQFVIIHGIYGLTLSLLFIVSNIPMLCLNFNSFVKKATHGPMVCPHGLHPWSAPMAELSNIIALLQLLKHRGCKSLFRHARKLLMTSFFRLLTNWMCLSVHSCSFRRSIETYKVLFQNLDNFPDFLHWFSLLYFQDWEIFLFLNSFFFISCLLVEVNHLIKSASSQLSESITSHGGTGTLVPTYVIYMYMAINDLKNIHVLCHICSLITPIFFKLFKDREMMLHEASTWPTGTSQPRFSPGRIPMATTPGCSLSWPSPRTTASGCWPPRPSQTYITCTVRSGPGT